MERDWTTLYCERNGLSIFAEPLNTASNLAFLIAAIVALVALRRQGLHDLWTLCLVGLTLAIFIGSTAFHAMPNGVTVLMDVVPIQLFMFAYLALALKRFLDWPWSGVVVGLLIFIGAVLLLPRFFPQIGAVSAYVTALLALALVGSLALPRNRKTGLTLLAAGGVFAFSLTARQLDMPLCATIPIGMHWIWHLLNGVVLGILLLAAIKHRAGAILYPRS